MSKEDELAEKIAQVQKMAEADPKIDAQTLIKNLLENSIHEDLIPAGMKARAYLVSLLAPPFGLYYVIKFFLRVETDAKKQAWLCLALTGIGLLILQLLGNALFSSPELKEIQNIRPQDIQELLN